MLKVTNIYVPWLYIDDGYDNDNHNDDGDGIKGQSRWWWSCWLLLSVLLIYLSLSFFMTAVCSSCRGAHYKSRKAHGFMSGEQVS